MLAQRVSLRAATPNDEADIARVAYATGFFGAPAAHHFPDAALFADVWVRPYLRGPGCCNHVAELSGEVVGYIIGTCSLTSYRRYLAAGLAPYLLRRLLTGHYPGWRRSYPFLRRALRYPTRHAPARDYPAQLHINLLPEARGHGLGKALMTRFLDCLQEQQVTGVQLSTTRENDAAIGLYEKFGFRVILERPSCLWRPWLGRDAVHVVMGLKLEERVA